MKSYRTAQAVGGVLLVSPDLFAALSLVGFALCFPRRLTWEERARVLSR